MKPNTTFDTPRSLKEAMRQALAEKGIEFPEEKDNEDDQFPHGLEQAFVPPASPQDYNIVVPDHIERDPALEDAARAWFHKAGLPQGTVNGIIQEYCRHCESEDLPSSFEPMQALRREWGNDFERKIALARHVIDGSGSGEDIDAILAASGLGNSLWLIRTLAAIGELRQARQEI